MIDIHDLASVAKHSKQDFARNLAAEMKFQGDPRARDPGLLEPIARLAQVTLGRLKTGELMPRRKQLVLIPERGTHS